MKNNLKTEFGDIDIYLFDQLLKGRFDDCMRVIDVGCGGGRNLVYFLRQGYEVYGVDRDPESIELLQGLSEDLAPDNSVHQFVVARAEEIPYKDGFFDLAICNALFHFANNTKHFDAMVRSVWRVLKPGGYLFARLASDIGIEELVQPRGDGRFLLPDGTVRFLVNEQMLLDYSSQLKGELYEPIKTTNVNNIRCMTTWCLRKKV
jgi:SAM-dependent methyltransferase